MTELDDYLVTLDAPTREAFTSIKDAALTAVPDAEQGRSYGLAALTYRGKGLLGFLAAKQHLSIFPFSPAAVDAVRDQLDGFDLSKGTIRFGLDQRLPDEVVRTLVIARRDEITPPG